MNQKNIVFPEGMERIGNHWFYNTDIESVTIPASVKEIGADAFCRCEELTSVTLAENSKLEKLGAGCFAESGLEKLTIPRSIRELKKSVFKDCLYLEEVTFEESS